MEKIIKIALMATTLSLMTACSGEQADGPPDRSVDVSKIKNATPKKLAYSKYGNPKKYTIKGKTYYTLKTSDGYDKVGRASWYGTRFNNIRTSSGETYDMFAMTAANKVLPIPCYVKVTNLENHKTIIVKVNDRGPFKPGRIIDLSYVAALKLGMMKTGTARVRVTAINTHKSIHKQGMKTLYVQAGSYLHKSYAHAFAKKMEKVTGLKALLKPAKVHKQTYTRVYLGPIDTVAKALLTEQQLQKRGIKHPLMLTSLS